MGQFHVSPLEPRENMSDKESPKEIIDAYRKQQVRSQRWPKIVFWSFVIIILVATGGLIFWFTRDSKPEFSLPFLASKTPTPTETYTPSPVPPSSTPTLTPTEVPPTDTPTITPSPTISGPFIYTVQEGDTLYSIAETYGVEILVLIEANRERLELDPANPIIKVGDELLVPPPGTELATPTPLPEGLPRGTRIEYMVKSGDTLAAIAFDFNSTVDDILEVNKLEDPNSIYVGQILIVRVNLVTPVPTLAEPEATLTPTTES
jgi:LysM repeat protein